MTHHLHDRETWLVNRAHLRAHALLQEAFAAAGTRAYVYRILAAADELHSVSQAELGRSAGLDRSDVSSAVETLAEKGLVTRTAHPGDRRLKVVALTPEGRAELIRLDAVLDDVQERFLGPLNRQERAAFRALIARLGDEPFSTA